MGKLQDSLIKCGQKSDYSLIKCDLWKSLPAQLSKENRKFIYGVVREGARAREYELALQWLLDAGLIYKVYNVKAPRLPLASYEDRAAFKIFVLDVGLLGAMSNHKWLKDYFRYVAL